MSRQGFLKDEDGRRRTRRRTRRNKHKKVAFLTLFGRNRPGPEVWTDSDRDVHDTKPQSLKGNGTEKRAPKKVHLATSLLLSSNSNTKPQVFVCCFPAVIRWKWVWGVLNKLGKLCWISSFHYFWGKFGYSQDGFVGLNHLLSGGPPRTCWEMLRVEIRKKSHETSAKKSLQISLSDLEFQPKESGKQGTSSFLSSKGSWENKCPFPLVGYGLVRRVAIPPLSDVVSAQT